PHRPANHQLESDRCPRIRHGHSRNHLFPLDSYHKCNFGSSVVKVGYTELDVNSSTACSVSSSERYSLLIDSWLKYRREAAVHSSCCSWRTAPARRITAARLGKIPTTSVRRPISRLRRSKGLVECNWRRCSEGNARYARMSSSASSSS